jgi:hypothetical protein
VFNNNFDPKHAKSIIDAINFSQENKNLYRPARINHVHHYKLFPRHPLHTACMFSPKQYITEMKTYNKDKIPEHGKLIAGISNRIFNEQYEREFILLPNQLLILDQIITQWKIVQGDQNDLKMIPLWFKTNLRKHFNYSV